MMAQLTFIGLPTLATRINKRDMSLRCCMQCFVVPWQYFHVAG